MACAIASILVSPKLMRSRQVQGRLVTLNQFDAICLCLKDQKKGISNELYVDQ